MKVNEYWRVILWDRNGKGKKKLKEVGPILSRFARQAADFVCGQLCWDSRFTTAIPWKEGEE